MKAKCKYQMDAPGMVLICGVREFQLSTRLGEVMVIKLLFSLNAQQLRCMILCYILQFTTCYTT